jgi:hypothetical protein
VATVADPMASVATVADPMALADLVGWASRGLHRIVIVVH